MDYYTIFINKKNTKRFSHEYCIHGELISSGIKSNDKSINIKIL